MRPDPDARGAGRDGARGDARLPDEVARLRDRFRTMKTARTAEAAHELLDLPGPARPRPLSSPMPTPAVASTSRPWALEPRGRLQRVELVEAGLPQPVISVVSRWLWVSEEALDEKLPGQLYVYAGTISPLACPACLAWPAACVPLFSGGWSGKAERGGTERTR